MISKTPAREALAGLGAEADRAPACGVPGYCSRRSGTAARCAAAASPPRARAACSSAARAPTSPPSASAAPAPARERRAATRAARAPRRPCGRERGGPRAPMAGCCSRRHRGSPAQGPREGAGCERRSHARPGATGPGHVAPKSATGTTSEGAKLSPPGCELGHPARGQARRSRQTGALPGRENRAEAL